VEIEISENEKSAAEDSNNLDPYELVYSNIPQNTHMLKSVENCRFCNAKKFEYESKGLCCRNG
jgi:hypothetical protein